MAESERISYHVTTSQTLCQNRSQIFVLSTGSDRFESEKKPLSLLFLTSKKALPVPKTKIWDLFWNQDCDVVNNLLVEIAINNFDLFHYALNVLEFMYSVFFKNNCGSQLYSYEKQRVIIFQMKTLTLVRCQRLSQHNFYQRQLFLSLTPGERMSDYKVVPF